MSGATQTRILASARDQAMAERLRAALESHGVHATAEMEGLARKDEDIFVILCSAQAQDDLEFSRSLIAVLECAPRSRLRLVAVEAQAEKAEDLIPPILMAERGEDGFLRPVEPPLMIGSVMRDAEIPQEIIQRLGGTSVGRKAAVRSGPAGWKNSLWPNLAVAAAAAVLGCAGASLWLAPALQEARQEARRADAFASALMAGMTERLPDSARRAALHGVAEEALAALGPDDPDRLDDAALGRRAQLWRLLAESEDVAGNPDTASEAFRLAYQTTQEILSRDPDDPQRRFDHAQSAFWLANSAYRRGELEAAGAGFEEYAALVSALAREAPDNALYQAESAHADVNLGLIALEDGRPETALARFDSAIRTFRFGPVTAGTANREDVANAIAWRADALAALGRSQDALDARVAEARIHRAELSDRPDDAFVRRRLANSLRAQATLLTEKGRIAEADGALEEALASLEALRVTGSENARFRRLYMQALHERARIALWAGDLIRAKLLVDQARRTLADGDPEGADDERHVTRAELQLLAAQIAQASGALSEARADIDSATDSADLAVSSGRESARALAAETHFIQGEILNALGQSDEAMRAYRRADRYLEDSNSDGLAAMDLSGRVQWRLGNLEAAAERREALIAAQYQRPDFIAFWDRESQPATVERGDKKETDDDEL